MKKKLSNIKLLLVGLSGLFISKAAFAQVEVITDGGFEAGSPSAAWTEASTNFGTPLCTVAGCGTGTGTGPHSGSTWWAWFGGSPTVMEEGSLTQTVTLAASSTATLSFYLEQIVCDDPLDFMDVVIDGTDTIFHTDGSSALCGILGYTLQTVNMDAYCDGSSHTLQFHSITFSTNGGPSNFFVDDVSLMVTTSSGSASCDTTIIFSPALAIPDGDPLGVTDIGAVAGVGGTALGTDVILSQVCFDITHTYVGDLLVTLTAPNGTVITLMDQPGVPATTFGCSGDNVSACIVPGTGNEMENVCDIVNIPAISGSFTAANATDLAAINAAGGSPNGDWVLFVSDNAAVDEGILDNWSLVFDQGLNSSAAWATDPDTVCATGTSIDLTTLVTGTAGGTWSGSGVTGSTFDATGLSGAASVTYTVIDAVAGCSKSESHAFTVVPATPACSFTANVVNTTATFTNATTGAESYSWDFGDGSASDVSTNPSHNYATNGIYTVTLSATNVCGTVTCTQTITISGCPELIADGGFEAGTPSAAWTEASTNFGTPLCTVAACGVGGGTGPNNGSTWWSFFGGIPATLEDASLTQSVTIPAGTAANLYFYLEVPVCDDPGDFLDVVIDGTDTVFHTDGSSALCTVIGYALQTINMTAYADGNSHSIQFHSITLAPNGGVTNFMVDDVSLLACPTGINEQSIAEEISVLPNPANNFITISMKSIKASKVNVNIYNVLGQPVYSKVVDKTANDFSQQLNISKWTKGAYVLRIQAGDKSITRNIIIQ